ncbi:GNAT family N-acetyltransferase [Ornithinibacillus contaminans]|uniref:GNAT family N-acetyltransferase n=1 Tax=Ornithinibacillus contaminans TaxID=694055 RepID=UPI00064E03F9|nr:GNAT family N-acetyltransferase [Ornithinibacillus contaminans]
MRLVRPSEEWEREHKAYVEEWGPDRMVPSSFSLAGFDSYDAYLVELGKRESGTGQWLPCTNYFLVNDRKRIVAMVDIRHELNDHLYRVGGHIGYGVRPSERKKGYATLILAMALEKCKELGIEKVLVTCDEDNIGSAKVILANGGIEDKPELNTDEKVTRRFWIALGNGGDNDARS